MAILAFQAHRRLRDENESLRESALARQCMDSQELAFVCAQALSAPMYVLLPSDFYQCFSGSVLQVVIREVAIGNPRRSPLHLTSFSSGAKNRVPRAHSFRMPRKLRHDVKNGLPAYRH